MPRKELSETGLDRLIQDVLRDVLTADVAQVTKHLKALAQLPSSLAPKDPTLCGLDNLTPQLMNKACLALVNV